MITTRDLASVLLLALSLTLIVIGQKAFMEGCVCIVNAILRAVVSLSAAVVLGSVHAMVPAEQGVLDRTLAIVQLIALALGCFFLTQHAFFLLEAA